MTCSIIYSAWTGYCFNRKSNKNAAWKKWFWLSPTRIKKNLRKMAKKEWALYLVKWLKNSFKTDLIKNLKLQSFNNLDVFQSTLELFHQVSFSLLSTLRSAFLTWIRVSEIMSWKKSFKILHISPLLTNYVFFLYKTQWWVCHIPTVYR